MRGTLESMDLGEARKGIGLFGKASRQYFEDLVSGIRSYYSKRWSEWGYLDIGET